MQRYFITSDQLVDNQVIMKKDDVHHIVTVMRGNVGDNVIVCCDKKSYLTEITELNKSEVLLKIVETKEEDVELPVFVSIAQGIIKGDKFDFVIQKGTECGAHVFLPVAMKRSVAKIEANKAAKKVERWQKIALEAARQAHRQVVPAVMEPVDVKDLVAMACEYDVCLFAYESFDAASKNRLATVANGLSAGQRVLVLIGPEGGIDETEVTTLETAGFQTIGLGPRILRTETAPIYVMAALSYALEIAKKEV